MKFKTNRRGIIIISVLWVVAILSMIAISLGRQTHVEINLTKLALAEAEARFVAWSGIEYAKKLLADDSINDETKTFDNLYLCGITKTEQPLAEQFRIELENGSFQISYPQFDPQSENLAAEIIGFRDEERLININALDIQSYQVLISLITLFGHDAEQAREIASAVIDWKDNDTVPLSPDYGAEDDYYRDYAAKNRPFDSLEELKLIRGMSDEVYQDISPFLTIYPKKATRLRINFDTAPRTVLEALTNMAVILSVNTDQSDARNLVEKLLEYRAGEDNKEFTEDDRSLEFRDLQLTNRERPLFLYINQYRTKISEYFYIRSVGQVGNDETISIANAVISRKDLKIVDYWRE